MKPVQIVFAILGGGFLFILLLIVGLFFLVPDEKEDALPQFSYEIIEKDQISHAQGLRIEWRILAPEALTSEELAGTAIAAAKKAIESHNATEATIILEQDAESSGSGEHLCVVHFSLANGEGWDVKVADSRPSPQAIQFSKKFKDRFNRLKAENGTVTLDDETLIYRKLGAEFGLSEDEARLLKAGSQPSLGKFISPKG